MLSFWIDNSYYPDFVNYDGNPTEAIGKLHKFARTLPKERKTEILLKMSNQLPYIVIDQQTEPVKKNSKIKSLPGKFFFVIFIYFYFYFYLLFLFFILFYFFYFLFIYFYFLFFIFYYFLFLFLFFFPYFLFLFLLFLKYF